MAGILDTSQRIRQFLANALDAQDEAMRIARYVGLVQHDPASAEPHLLQAMDGGNRQKSFTAAMVGVEIFRSHGDQAAAKAYAVQARFRADALGDPTSIAQAQHAQELADQMFQTSVWQQTAPATLKPLSAAEERTSGSVTLQQMFEGMGKLHASRDIHERNLFKELNKQQDVNCELSGTLVQDNLGRYGVRDETTGKTTLMDFGWSRQEVHRILDPEIGKTVKVAGSSSLWEEGKRMTAHSFYGSSYNIGQDSARKGFRITDPSAIRAAQFAKGRELG